MADVAANQPVVLLVEDDPVLRMMVGDFLADIPITVIEAYDASSALLALERNPSIRVLFTDIAMPGLLDGADLALEAAERWPGLRVFITTGKRMPPLTRIPVGCDFIPKPYDFENLAARLRRLTSIE